MNRSTIILDNFNRLFPEMAKSDFVEPKKPIYEKVQCYAIMALMAYCNLTFEESVCELSVWEGNRSKSSLSKTRKAASNHLQDRDKDTYLKEIIIQVGEMVAPFNTKSAILITEKLESPCHH